MPEGETTETCPPEVPFWRISAKVLRKHLELRDGTERDIQAHVFSLRLVVNRRSIDSVERQVIVIDTMASEPDCPLIAGAVIDRAGRKRR